MKPILAFFILIATSAATFGQNESPRAFVDRAIRAIGGEEKLRQIKGYHYEYELKIPSGRVIKSKITFALPDRARTETEHWDDGADKPALKFVQITNKDRFHLHAEIGNATLAPKEKLAKIYRVTQARTVSRLLPLKSPEKTLTWLKDEEIDKGPVKVMLVKHADLPDVKLAFDPKTALLVQMEWKEERQDEEILIKLQYRDRVDVNGILMAKKQRTIVKGQQPVEIEYRVIRWLPNVDEKLFAIPN